MPQDRVFVVDNGSTDNSVEELKARHGAFHFLEMGENRGYSAGNNAGIRRALSRGADYVWILNNDTEPQPGVLAAMLDVADRDARIGAMGSRIDNTGRRPARPVFGGGKVHPWLGIPRHHRQPPPPEDLDYIIGANILLRSSALREIGLLDEDFFLYWEDVDLCFRLRRHGWRLAVAEHGSVRHRENGSLSRADPVRHFHFTVSTKRFFRKYSQLPAVPILMGTGAWILRNLSLGRPRCAWAVCRALWFE
jgi:GT2 family glycosyltransferase